MRDLDSEVIFNTLLADGVDAPTAYAASIVDSEPQPASRNAATNRFYFDLGLVAGLVALVAYYLT